LIVLIVLAALWAVSSEVPFFATVKAGVRGVPCCGSIPLGVILVSVALIAVVVPLSMVIVAVVVSLTAVVSLPVVGSVSVNVHGDWSVVHPSWGVG